LAKAVGISRREAFAVAAEVWAWVAVQAVDGVVPQTEPESLDSVADIAGLGKAMLQAGLVGVVNDGLVLPAELRHHERDEQGGGPAGLQRSKDAIRSKRYRDRNRLKVPAPRREKQTPTAEAPRQANQPRRLGEVEGCSVMLLFRRDGVPFYKLTNASPMEYTGTVADQRNPSFADALMSLHSAMKQKVGRRLGGDAGCSPTMDQLLAAAERERDRLKAAAADDARRAEANRSLAEASADDQEDALEGGDERDENVTRHAPSVTPVTRHDFRHDSRHAETSSTPENETICDDSDRHAFRHADAPSSSSSLCMSSSQEEIHEEETTTTSRARDAAQGIERLEQFLERQKPKPSKPYTKPPSSSDKARQSERYQQMAERFADALGIPVDEVIRLWTDDKDGLRARLEAKGIDPNTGNRSQSDFTVSHSSLRQGLAEIGITPPVKTLDQDDMLAIQDDRELREVCSSSYAR
jgi:hypothetical protein